MPGTQATLTLALTPNPDPNPNPNPNPNPDPNPDPNPNQKPRADVIMSPSALTACPSAVELLGSGEYPDGETSVRPLTFLWETCAQATLTTHPSSPNH